MTNNFSNQPPSPTPKSQSPRGFYNPIRLGDSDEEFGLLDSRLMRLLAALLFTIIFVVTWKRPEFAALTILVLAGCLLYRLDERQRKLATAPLILAAIRLCLMLSAPIAGAGSFPLFSGSPVAIALNGGAGNWGVTWIPVFLSVCLFYLPGKDSITLKIVAFEAIAVILSSLLPGEGFASVLTIFNATLFFAVTIGLLFDLKPGLRELFRAPQYQQAPVRVQFPVAPPPRPVG